MKSSLQLVLRVAIGTLLCVLSAFSYALTFDKLSAAPLIGRALQVSVIAQLAPEEDPSSLCLDAEVYYADNRQSSVKLSVAKDLAHGDKSVIVKIVSHNAVDEPVVTVYLRSGCVSKVTRRYVLLADVVTETTANFLAPTVSRTDKRESVNIPNQQIMEASNTKPEIASKGKKNAEQSKSTNPTKSHVKVASASNTTLENSQKQPRLKLVPLNLGIEFNPELRSSSELLSTPTEDTQKRAQAAAIWRSLSATPEEIAQTNSRLDSLEKEVKAIIDAKVADQKRVTELTHKVNQAESRQYFNPLVFSLSVLLILLILALLFLYSKWRKIAATQQIWWKSDSISPVQSSAEASHAQGVNIGDEVRVGLAQDVVAQVPAVRHVDLLLDEPLPTESGFGGPQKNTHFTSGNIKNEVKDFAHSGFGAFRELNTEELLDVRQQAAFFMALGQHDQAVGILEGRIKESSDANPLMYLDLLEFLHKLGRKREYDLYRTQFNHIFTGRVPEFDDFLMPSLGLEEYPKKLEKIIMLWPQQAALAFIEQSLVRHAESVEEYFELEAFRELLILHAIAIRIGGKVTAGHSTFSAPTQAMLSADKALLSPSAATGAGAIQIDFDLSESAEDLIQFDAEKLSNNSPLN